MGELDEPFGVPHRRLLGSLLHLRVASPVWHCYS